MKLSEAYVEDRRRIREKLNHDVRALEKSRSRAQKALSDATQTQMNHLITKVCDLGSLWGRPCVDYVRGIPHGIFLVGS